MRKHILYICGTQKAQFSCATAQADQHFFWVAALRDNVCLSFLYIRDVGLLAGFFCCTADFSPTRSETSKTAFLATRLIGFDTTFFKHSWWMRVSSL